ncbi:MAG: hypothetical protein U9Q70_07355 [Chloroflexota bacterium]|nr:hypothetical protein [Chloroflexota bacterium]
MSEIRINYAAGLEAFDFSVRLKVEPADAARLRQRTAEDDKYLEYVISEGLAVALALTPRFKVTLPDDPVFS